MKYKHQNKATDQYLWMQINHSKADIDFIQIKSPNQELQIRNILNRYYSSHIGNEFHIDRVNEISGTENYRVRSEGKKSILLRIHKRITSEFTIKILQLIQCHIYKSDVFFGSPINDCLIPLHSNYRNTYEKLEKDNLLMEAYPLAENVKHFSGENLEQIENVARKYGAVQYALKQLDKSIDIKALSEARPGISWFIDNKSLFNHIYNHNEIAKNYPHPDILTDFFYYHRDFLKKTWEEIKPIVDNRKPSLEGDPLLNDFHPHNTFFQENQCVLIYDYEAVSKYWPIIEALSFTIHRFVREYIRLHKESIVNIVKESSRIVNVFLENYQKGGGSVPNDFIKIIDQGIKITNLGKLLEIMSYNYRIGRDPAKRSSDFRKDEFIKFLIFLKEAEIFNKNLETERRQAGGSSPLNKKKIFLASSSELEKDRKEFKIFINEKNNDWVNKGIFLELIVWEDFLDAVSQTRLQDEYNMEIRKCDIFVMLFFTKVGKYTEEEFETAFGQFKATNRPLIFTYFKDAEINTSNINEDVVSLLNFKKKLEALGHYYTTYNNIDELKFKFNKQLDKLAVSDFIG